MKFLCQKEKNMAGNLITDEIFISGMTCEKCAERISEGLSEVEGVERVDVSFASSKASVEYDPDVISFDEMCEIVRQLGYESHSVPQSDAKDNLVICVVVAVLFLIFDASGILNLLAPDIVNGSAVGYAAMFAAGLAASVHCIAMCGGINLSQSLPTEHGRRSNFARPVLYNLGRVISYTAIGAVLGAIGMILGTTTNVGVAEIFRIVIKLAVGAFMVIIGVNMLNVLAPLRKLTLHLPIKISGNVRAKLFGGGAFAVGLLNGFMPCGPLQSMEAAALASAHPLTGAASMFVFALGTVPLMVGFGTLASLIGTRFKRFALKAGGVIVVVMGFAMISQGCALSGLLGQNMVRLIVLALCAICAVHNLPWGREFICAMAVAAAFVFAMPLFSCCGNFMPAVRGAHAADRAVVKDGVQMVKSILAPGSYPNIEVRAGLPVKWSIRAPEGSLNGCNYIVYLGDFGVKQMLSYGDNLIEFTPEKAGTYWYSCWMGMIDGKITVK